jgi:hypothetical protein
MKILILQKKVESAVTYYRTNVPFAELGRSHGHDVDFMLPKDVTNDILHKYDVVVFHRPELDIEMRILWLCHVAGIKIWVDIDDLLWKIPTSNPASVLFTPESKTNLQRGFINADVVTCSTPALKEAIMAEFGVEAHILPNAYNDREPLTNTFQRQREKALVLYRGSNTHDGDLFTYRDAFKPYQHIDYNFMGLQPWYMFKRYGGQLDRLFLHGYKQSVLDYFAVIENMKPNFFVFPLEDNEFNRCKSNIAAIEATMAGAVIIAPSYMPEFAKIDGALLFDDERQLGEILSTIDYDFSQHEDSDKERTVYAKLFNRQLDWVTKNVRLTQINDKRNQLLSVCI